MQTVLSSTSKALQLASEIKEVYSYKPKRPRIFLDDHYEVTRIYVSSSLIKKMFFRGEPRDFCPSKLYWVEILRHYVEEPTGSMLNGLYFESMLLGATADGTAVKSLPLKHNGDKTIDNIRIDMQVSNAIAVMKSHGMIINKDGPLKNVQLYKCISFPDYKKDDVQAFLEMTLDIVSPLELGSVSYSGAIIDLKLTKSLKTEFGEFCWGKPEYMDHTQGFIYSFYLGLPFFYLVFDYPSTGMNYRFVPINTNMSHPDPVKAQEAQMRFRETHELIRKTIDMLIEFHHHGWYTHPTYDNCKNCPVLECPDRGKNQEI